jgi:hypothetical protein
MKKSILLFILFGVLRAFAQTPTPHITGVSYSGATLQIDFTPQANPFQPPGYDSARTEVVLITQLTTSLNSAQSLGENADHPVLSTWFATGDHVTVPVKPTYRARYFVSARYSARSQGHRVYSSWSTWSNSAGPIAVSASPDTLEETPEAQATLFGDIGPGSLVEARFSLFPRSSSNTEILLNKAGQPPLRILNPETIVSAGGLIVASSLAAALSQATASTQTFLLREVRSGQPTLYRLFHSMPSLTVGDTVHFSLINPDGRILHDAPLFVGNPGTAFRMGRAVQKLLCHPPIGQDSLFTSFTAVKSPDSITVGLFAVAMLRLQIPHASLFEEATDAEGGFSSTYLQAYDSSLAVWAGLSPLAAGLSRLRQLQTRMLPLARGPIGENYPDPSDIAPPVLAYEAYTRFSPTFPLLTKPQGAVALLTLVTPNISLYSLRRESLSVSFTERVNASQVAGLLLPADSATLNPVLRNGLYLRAKSSTSNTTTQYGMVQRVVRRPLGEAGRGGLNPQPQILTPGGMVKAGIIQAGLGETGFQVWPRSEKGPWITFAPQGQFVVGRQQRRIVFDQNKRIGDFIHLAIGGPDSSMLVADGTPQEGEQPGIAKATWLDVRAVDSVGSDTGALWFRALDWSRNGSGDTVLHRVYEKRGALLNLCLGKQTDGPADSVLYHRALLEERLRMRAGCPDFLGKLKGFVQLTLPPGTQAYRVPAGQFLGPQHRMDNASPLWERTLTGVRLRLNLEMESHRQTLAALFDGEPWSLLISDRGRSRVEMQYQPPGDISGGIASRVGLEEEVTEGSVIVADFDHNGKVDSIDEAAARRGERWSIWSDPETNPGSINSSMDNNEKAVELLNYLPFRVRLRGPLSPYQNVFFQGNSNREISVVQQDSNFVDMGFYIKNPGASPLISRLQAKTLDDDRALELERTSGNHWGLISFKNQGDNSINLMYSREGLLWKENTLKVECTDILRKITVFSARYNPEVSFAEDEDPQEESIDSYRWEDNRLLNQSPYTETTFKSFLHRRLKEFDGVDLGRPDETLKDSLNVVYIHGFNVHESLGNAYTADRSFYKRLYHMGLKGNMISFHWFGDVNGFQSRTVAGVDIWSLPWFSVDQSYGFRTSAIFRSVLKNSLGGYRKALLAHSLGNQVSLDMLRLSKLAGDAPLLERYMMVEAAVWRETLIPVDPAKQDSVRRKSWRGLFTGSLDSTIKIFNTYNQNDNAALGAMCLNEVTKGKGDAERIRKLLNFPKEVCSDADVAALRTPDLLAYCKRSELKSMTAFEAFSGCNEEGMDSKVPIGRAKLNYDVIQPNLIEDINSRLIKGPKSKFLQEHSYYAFDPLWYTTHLYEKLLH